MDTITGILSAVGGVGGLSGIAAGVRVLLDYRNKKRDQSDHVILESKKLVLEAGKDEFASNEAVHARVSKEQADLIQGLKDQVAILLKRVQECDERSNAQDRRADARAAEFEAQIETLRMKIRKLAEENERLEEENRITRHDLANFRQASRLDREMIREQLNLAPGPPDPDMRATPSVPDKVALKSHKKV